VVNGRINQGAPLERTAAEPFWSGYSERNQLFLNDGEGRFTEDRTSGGRLTGVLGVSRGLAAATSTATVTSISW